jgi:hypothetical protein
MEFIQSIDFTIVALIICLIYEVLGKGFNMYLLASSGNMKKEDIQGSSCLVGLFYIVFIFVLLWSPILWLPALLLIFLGMITGAVTRQPLLEVKELLASGMNPDAHAIYQKKSIARIYWTIDKILSAGLLCWMIYLHLQFLGIIA